MHSIENRKLEKWEVIFQRHTQPHTCKAGQPQNHTTKLRPKLTIAEYMSHKIWPPPFNGILLPKLFLPTVRKNCSCDREKRLKFEAEGLEFVKILRSLEQYTVFPHIVSALE